MLDKRLEKTIHQIQGQLTISTNKTWSESKILNMLLYVAICHPKVLTSFDLSGPLNNFFKGKTLEVDESLIKILIEVIKNDNLKI